MSSGQSGEASSSSSPQASGFERRNKVHQLNESLYELHRPERTPNMVLLFFHGLQSEDDFSDAHLSTWRTEDGTIWPREWLVEYFPGAHILTVSYRAVVGSCSGGNKNDMYVIVENLIYDLMEANIGQTQNCPIVLVGHCFGGLVIEELCLESSKPIKNWRVDETAKPKTFLENVRGIFYYGTPHHGSPFISTQAGNVHDSPLLEYFRTLSAKAERLNYEFDLLRRSYGNWRVHALGETLRTKSGVFRDILAVPEASSRGGDLYNVVEADHISISKPQAKHDRRFYSLKELLRIISITSEKEAREREEAHAKEAHPENFQHLPEHIVGIDAQVLAIKSKLETVRILDVRGMGGLGKTTAAMAVFNELGPKFEYSCFLRDVKLIKGTVDDVKTAIRERMHYCGKRAEGDLSKLRGQRLLLVLDDISDRDCKVLLDLATETDVESRFITTSRELDLLSGTEKICGEIYKVPFLTEDSARTLFLGHAYSGQKVPPELESPIKAIVQKCDGLPLTLVVLGKFLKKKQNRKDWEQAWNALDTAEHVKSFDERLWEKLKLSYNGLGFTEQQMFLDATSFFSNNLSWNLGEAKAAWRVAYKTTSERPFWDTLVDASLVYNVEEDKCIKVHEQLQSLGRRIASEPINDGKRRVWDDKVALKMLRSTKNESGKEIHALRFSRNQSQQGTKDIHIGSIALGKLRKLRFFEAHAPVVIDRVNNHVSVPAKLVLLRCIGDDLFNPVIQTRLVVLDLSHVESLPPSIGQLTVLQYLKIRNGAFHELPPSFGRLKSLCHLLFYECSELESLPETFGQLSALKHLDFSWCNSLHTLPESFGQLSDLNHLIFFYCNLHTLPESFGQLSALKHLKFTNCDSLDPLPESFGQLSALELLVFMKCDNLHTLPQSFGQLSALEDLRFMMCGNLQTLPESFGELSALNHLYLFGCESLQTLPESFGQLSALKDLTVKNCNSLCTLPESFGKLESALKHLDFDECNSSHVWPESFGQPLYRMEDMCNIL